MIIGLKLMIVYVLVHFISYAQIVNQTIGDRFTLYRLEDWVSYAPSLEVTCLEADLNYIYFGTTKGGILRFHRFQEKWDIPFTMSSGLSSNTILQLAYNDEENFLYARTLEGIDVYKPAEAYWRPSMFDIPSSPTSEPYRSNKDYRFPAGARPNNEDLPDFFTDIGMMYHLGGIIQDEHNRNFNFTDRISDHMQRLWIGTDGMGPMMADLYTRNLEWIPRSIPNISPRDVFIDQDYMWIGGLHRPGVIHGITLWERNNNHWYYYEAPFLSGLYYDEVLCIAGNENCVLFATEHGLSYYNYKKDQWKSFTMADGLEGERINDIIIKSGYAFIGTEAGFNWLDLSSLYIYELDQRTLDNYSINQLAIRGEIIWAATYGGLYSIDLSEEKINFHPSRAALPDQNLQAIEIINDKIWLANERGIAYWDLKNDKWKSFPALSLTRFLSAKESRIIFRDIDVTDEIIWFATNFGLLKFDQSKNYWFLYTVKDGLMSNNLFHIDPEGSYLWISTDEGLTRFLWRRND
jgi:ligand-binding sensor domain-containing protein